MDTVLTSIGRRDIAEGRFNAAYVTFTDGATFYSADVVSGSSDASARFYFEQCSLLQDQVTFEGDESGNVRPFGSEPVKDGKLIKYVFNTVTSSLATSASQGTRFLSGDEFSRSALGMLTASLDNLNKLYVIGTRDAVFEDEGFAVSSPNIEFTVHDQRPIPDVNSFVVHINQLESIFNDVRFNKVKNFDYLPPLNKITDSSLDKTDFRSTSKYALGHYKPWGRVNVLGLSPAQLEFELSHFERMGYAKTIIFDPTSNDNTLFAQFFEVGSNTVKKLDVIDYGVHAIGSQTKKHVFFVGKVLIDGRDTHTFIHIFTLVFG